MPWLATSVLFALLLTNFAHAENHGQVTVWIEAPGKMPTLAGPAICFPSQGDECAPHQCRGVYPWGVPAADLRTNRARRYFVRHVDALPPCSVLRCDKSILDGRGGCGIFALGACEEIEVSTSTWPLGSACYMGCPCENRGFACDEVAVYGGGEVGKLGEVVGGDGYCLGPEEPEGGSWPISHLQNPQQLAACRSFVEHCNNGS